MRMQACLDGSWLATGPGCVPASHAKPDGIDSRPPAARMRLRAAIAHFASACSFQIDPRYSRLLPFCLSLSFSAHRFFLRITRLVSEPSRPRRFGPKQTPPNLALPLSLPTARPLQPSAPPQPRLTWLTKKALSQRRQRPLLRRGLRWRPHLQK